MTGVQTCALPIFAACGNPEYSGTPAPPEENESIEQNQNTELPDDNADETNETEEENTQPDPAETEQNDADVDSPADEQPVKVAYEMNGIYDIVPIDETANENVVLLTFDDGPKEQEMLSEMLDILDKHEAKAIFFVNGYRVEQNPDLLKLIAERGHSIGNHSWDHIILRDLPQEEMGQQVEDVQEIVEELIGERPKFFRPPNGAGSDLLKEKVASEGMLYMTWSNGSEDWVYDDPDTVIQRVMEQLRPGSNILMHELPWTVEALDTLLTKISEEGYEFIHPESIQIPD